MKSYGIYSVTAFMCLQWQSGVETNSCKRDHTAYKVENIYHQTFHIKCFDF